MFLIIHGIIRKFVVRNKSVIAFLGAVAKWLGSGLQNRERRFESGRHLYLSE